MKDVDFPTLRWVKDSLDSQTLLPTGQPIRRRHRGDCPHWHEVKGSPITGGPPRRATREQMEQVEPCGSCGSTVRTSGGTEALRGPFQEERRFWWAIQRHRSNGRIPEPGTLWSPPRRRIDRLRLLEMQAGDVVLHYSNTTLQAVSTVKASWALADRPASLPKKKAEEPDVGWLVETEVIKVGNMVSHHDLRDLVTHGTPGLLDKDGHPHGNTYITTISDTDARRVLAAAGVTLPTEPGARPDSGDDSRDDENRVAQEAGFLGLPESHWDGVETDRAGLVRLRQEQGHLRRHLLAGREAAACALCGTTLPARLLVAAHIQRRSELTPDERRDLGSIAMLACALGCDALFEWGYVIVGPDGVIGAGRPPETPELKQSIAALVGHRCTAHAPTTAPRFQAHAAAALTS